MPARIAIILFLFTGLSAAERAQVLALLDEFDQIAAQPLWPGFAPRHTALAIYDGADSYLIRHPAPPTEFLPLEGRPEIRVLAGRHPAILANSSVEIGGTITATLLLSAGATGRAPILVHECFHVFQRRQHPTWAANEAALFTYPAGDAEGLALSRLETLALNRALAGERACWTSRALQLRRERFARLPADAVSYERGTEMNEGLAQYVEGIAAGRKAPVFRDFGPAEVRQRAYLSGEMLARLLDQTVPGWKAQVERSLDELLPEPSGAACDFTAEERQTARQRAQSDVEALKQRRAELGRMFDAQAGWRVVVLAAEGKPLMLQSFDPINVERLSEREILHKRMLQLSNEAGSLEILDHASLSVAAGAHPLFTGVRQWTVTGLPTRPEIHRDGNRISIAAPALKVSFTAAEVELRPQSIVLHLR